VTARPQSTAPTPDAPVEPAPAVDVPVPLTEPRLDWGDDPAEAAARGLAPWQRWATTKTSA
jgi:hypothetical protein